MKRIIKDKVIATTEIGFVANDGTYFAVDNRYRNEEQTKAECKKYEASASCVIAERVKEFKIADTENYSIDPFAMNDDPVEIFKIDNQNQLDALNLYIKDKITNTQKEYFLTEKYIGKEVILQWNYDMDWVIAMTYEDVIERFKNNYYSAIEKCKENK